MANDLLSIFQFGFMQRALIAGLVIATVCGVLGVFVVLRRTAPLGDALAHVSFGGVAIGIAAGLFPIEMAILIAVLGGIGIRVLQERHLYGELSLTVIQAAGLGGGVVVISMVGGLNVEILSFLFGQILTVTWSDVALIVVLLAATILVLAVLYKEFFLLTFDPEGARVSGLPVRALDTGFTVLTAITIVLAMQVVGVLLVSALLAVPAAAAAGTARRADTSRTPTTCMAKTIVIAVRTVKPVSRARTGRPLTRAPSGSKARRKNSLYSTASTRIVAARRTTIRATSDHVTVRI